MRCYTWGGVGKAKTRGEIVRRGGLIFLVLFVSRQKEQCNNQTLFAKLKKIKICATPANECYNRGFCPYKTS